MKITIITPVLNGERHIRETIESVFSQKGAINIEYIVIDGGSTDRTLDILKTIDNEQKTKNPPSPRLRKGDIKNDLRPKTYDPRPTFYWKSEKDRGIADAFNKGVRMAHGDFLYFLGADDVLKAPNVIERMLESVNPKKDMIVAGKVDRIRDSKKYSVVYTSSLQFSPWMLLYKMGLPHQGMFMNKRFFKKYGVFDIHLKYAMDYDLLLRAHHTFPRVVLKDIVVAGWREGGVGRNKIFDVLREYHKIRVKNRIAPIWILWLIHILSCIRYIPEYVWEKFILQK